MNPTNRGFQIEIRCLRRYPHWPRREMSHQAPFFLHHLASCCEINLESQTNRPERRRINRDVLIVAIDFSPMQHMIQKSFLYRGNFTWTHFKFISASNNWTYWTLLTEIFPQFFKIYKKSSKLISSMIIKNASNLMIIATLFW